jgi:transposase
VAAAVSSATVSGFACATWRFTSPGHTQAAVATVLGVTPQAVSKWVNAVRRNGSGALKAAKRGRRPGEQKALDPKQEARVRRAVLAKLSDQLALPGLVWTRPQVRQLVRNWFGIGLSVVTIGKYLRSWGLSPQKPIRRAYEQNPEALARWLEQEYSAIEAKARKQKVIILCLDQTGLRSDSSVGKGWAPVGQAPMITKTGKRFGTSVMAAISNKGELYFTCYRGSFTGPVFLGFLKRLVRQVGRKIHLIVDRHPVHRRVSVRDWLADNVAQIEMHLAA